MPLSQRGCLLAWLAMSTRQASGAAWAQACWGVILGNSWWPCLCRLPSYSCLWWLRCPHLVVLIDMAQHSCLWYHYPGWMSMHSVCFFQRQFRKQTGWICPILTHINTSSVTKYTKEENGGLNGNHLSKTKGASKFPLLLAKIFFAEKKLHFEHKLCLALGLENSGVGGFFVCFFLLALISWLFLLESFTGQWLNPFVLPAK